MILINDKNTSSIHHARNELYKRLIAEKLLIIDNNGVASVADSSSKASKNISLDVFEKLNAKHGKKLKAQTAGKTFENCIRDYVKQTFYSLTDNLRPGKWDILDLGNRNKIKLEDFVQYNHLKHLSELASKDPELNAALGNDYTVAPDIIISREAYTDEELNVHGKVVDNSTSLMTDIRKACSHPSKILHASISVKWTMRTDRAQNTRTEALNLIRNRKGHLPHIVAVTGECLPNRLSSLALGTGDIDCVYHIALYELQEAIDNYAEKNQAPELKETLDTLIKGRRLKDISDLPFDLCV